MNTCIDHGRVTGVNRHGYATQYTFYRRELLHRLVYCEAHAVTPESIRGKVVRHTCDNPRCINPEHLIIGTQADNMRDMVERGRQASGSRLPQTKLTNAIVAQIRSRYTPRCVVNGGAALAREYGVDQSIISKIINNKIWSK